MPAIHTDERGRVNSVPIRNLSFNYKQRDTALRIREEGALLQQLQSFHESCECRSRFDQSGDLEEAQVFRLAVLDAENP